MMLFLALTAAILVVGGEASRHQLHTYLQRDQCGVTSPESVDVNKFASVSDVRRVTSRICQGGLRLPGSPGHLRTVDYIKQQLSSLPEIRIEESDFELANWQPADNSLYTSARLTIENESVDIVSAIAYSLPTNGTAISGMLDDFKRHDELGQLIYLNATVDINKIDIKGKIVMRDYSYLSLPLSLVASFGFYATPDATNHSASYTRPFITPPHADLLAASLRGAAGYISAFNFSREQLQGYYSGHSGTHWLVPGVFTGAEQYATLRDAANRQATASIQIDATSGKARVPRIHATLPGASNETIVVATHTDGVTYTQENGPAALLNLAKYFSSIPKGQRAKTIMFAFEASHLAYQLDSDKSLARALDANYENGTVAFVLAIEHLGTRELESFPAPNDGPGYTLNYTGKGEAILWSVGEVQPAIDTVIEVVKARGLDNTIVAPGLPPANPPNQVPTYSNMGGLGGYYTNALLPTMALISGPWSLWAPSFGADALDYERLRMQHIAVGDIILKLSRYSKQELAGNYTTFRQQRAAGTKTANSNEDGPQFITGPNGTYY